jgi:predicted O-methyltransferase YrrM
MRAGDGLSQGNSRSKGRSIAVFWRVLTMLRAMIKKIPGARKLHGLLKYAYGSLKSSSADKRELYPRGHFYSPLPDLEWVRSNAVKLFRKDVDIGNSVDLRRLSQESLLRELASYYSDFNFPAEPASGVRYYFKNAMFGMGSAFSLYAMFRHFQPKRIVEVGSGFTSALMLDVSERYLQRQVALTFIEPYPERLRSLLRPDDDQRCRIHEKSVQEVPYSVFEELGPNDILFVDSSHVSKIGSDVNFLIFEILPRLKPGVIIHFHDIYWPFEYPDAWIYEGRSWNEAYTLRAFLQYNEHFEILQFNDFLAFRFREFYRQHLPAILEDPGSSLWLRRKQVSDRGTRPAERDGAE